MQPAVESDGGSFFLEAMVAVISDGGGFLPGFQGLTFLRSSFGVAINKPSVPPAHKLHILLAESFAT